MRQINNVALGDNYTALATIENLYSGRSLVYLVANNSAFMQVQRATQVGQGVAEWSGEFLVNPSVGGFTGVVGVRFRNAVAGQTARVIAQIWETSDPQPVGGAVFDGTLAASGSVTPGGGVTELDYVQRVTPLSVIATTEGTANARCD